MINYRKVIIYGMFSNERNKDLKEGLFLFVCQNVLEMW